jgi:hypothetical protein
MHAHYWLLVLSLVRSPYRPGPWVLPTALPQLTIILFQHPPHSLHAHRNIKSLYIQCLHSREIVQLNFGPAASVEKMASPCH